MYSHSALNYWIFLLILKYIFHWVIYDVGNSIQTWLVSLVDIHILLSADTFRWYVCSPHRDDCVGGGASGHDSWAAAWSGHCHPDVSWTGELLGGHTFTLDRTDNNVQAGHCRWTICQPQNSFKREASWQIIVRKCHLILCLICGDGNACCCLWVLLPADRSLPSILIEFNLISWKRWKSFVSSDVDWF